jgi:hypothetical protein
MLPDALAVAARENRGDDMVEAERDPTRCRTR